ncbi:inositol polyphosphate kinase-domain-containing protein [Echria macrotheca]|uniref:Kinase n=1 Tax=Echria macrotheca TaxID=438768 RepID=A0AAJ0BK86_9PEZI|nr:inositol polyphosphate kinase-domain-containing protein [Echria macrotheca]
MASDSSFHLSIPSGPRAGQRLVTPASGDISAPVSALYRPGDARDPDNELHFRLASDAEIQFVEDAFKNHQSLTVVIPAFFGTLSTHGDGQQVNATRMLVQENLLYGFQKPNVCSVRLGRRLWDDTASLAKRQRFDQFSKQTTHSELGFAITGMRVYRGDSEEVNWDATGYQVFDRQWARSIVDAYGVRKAFRSFLFNRAAALNRDLGLIVMGAFLEDLRRLESVLERTEFRSYSSILQFIYEGDGRALRQAIDEVITTLDAGPNPNISEDLGSPVNSTRIAHNSRTTPELVALTLEDGGKPEDDDDELLEDLPRIYSLKLTDFSQARWTPGEGPDENLLFGVRNLIKVIKSLDEDISTGENRADLDDSAD